MAVSVGGQNGLLDGLLGGDGAGDPFAHVAGASATLRALAAGAEDVDGAAGAGANGGIDFTIPNGPADADIHAVATAFPADATYSQAQR
jgi:hypothetical protein